MEKKLLLEIIREAPFGFAYHKLIFDDQGKAEDYLFWDVNPAFEEMTGLKSASILGRRVTEILPDIRNSGFDWVEFYGNLEVNGEKQEITQYAAPLKRWYKVTAFAPEKGFFVTILQEITAEMKQIRILEEQKQQIRALSIELETVFNGTHDAMYLVRVEADEFRYIRNNTSHQLLTGFNLADIKDKTPIEITGRERALKLQGNFQRCVQAKKSITYEENLILDNEERAWITTLTPVFEKDKVMYLVGSSKDITLYKQAEDERNEAYVRLEAMFNGHNAVMLIMDPTTGKIVDANPAACDFYGYSRQEILDMHIQDINMLLPEDVANRRLLALQEKQTYFLFSHRLKNGDTKFVDVYSCPITHGQKQLLFSIIFDVTDREKYREALYQEKELWRTTFMSVGDGIVTTDKFGCIVTMNRAAEKITGWREETVTGKNFSQIFKLVSEVTGEAIEDPIAKVLRTGNIIGLANHTALINREGGKIPIADSAAPIRDDTGQVLGVVMVFRDVTQEKEQHDKILYLSYHDQLTGLHNRRFMEEALIRMDTANYFPLAVIMGDINGLKLTNDVFGHDIGDKLLIKAAKVIRENCCEEDIIVRWGGDEFLLLLPRTSSATAETVIQKIKERCLTESDEKVQLSIAFGCSVKANSEQDFQKVLKEAEELMYRSKLLEGKSYRNAIINTLLATLYEKNMETEEHAERLKDNCLFIGRHLEVSEKELENLALLAALHDIGKVGINQTILQKPGPLTKNEWIEMQKHPAIGYRIAQNTPELSAVADYILYHHERWDGKGYPKGLKENEIPLLCRILAVVDAYDAMTNDRVYRKAMPREEAMTEIRRNIGTQFDPQIAEIFLVRLLAL